MNSLQEAFNQALDEHLSLSNVAVSRIRQALNEVGIQLTEQQLTDLSDDLQKEGIESFTLDLNDEQLQTSGKTEAELHGIVINALDLEAIQEEEPLPDFEKSITVDIKKSVDVISADIHKELVEDQSNNIAYRVQSHDQIRESIQTEFQFALDRLQSMITVCIEVALDIINLGHGRGIVNMSATKFDALSRLFARSCQVSEETLLLLQSGFADGAQARWRTLHELTVVLSILAKADDETSKRYLEYSIIEDSNELLSYNDYCKFYGLPPIPEIKFQENQRLRDASIAQYGPEFTKAYGWVAKLIPKKRIQFDDLESYADLKHDHHFYKLASYNTHAGTKGLLYNLSFDHEKKLIFGRSVLGIQLPLYILSRSLLMCSTSFFHLFPSVDHLVSIRVLQLFAEEIRQFLARKL
ncbi:hypothetical protein EHQ23_02345 [Leptospira bourretii]|uniref:Uncharacterized protein n=1 Tax=Leptospira bourretii TaxID=2484962 RepID=A0A4R9INL1_9LEPT|nr:DUF5677 domain-containing protein [Leptospira bourretii]TGK89976.1 hypothetical protein EHQ23_02345 [Leptospira bourretii]TGK92199.1 hypothetical protein EHQ26_09490 [Leptospira bourretii]TGL36193.1 hypothetical protein EHQ45_07425 [Leptospira bourretii]